MIRSLSTLSHENNSLEINFSQSNSLDDLEGQILNLNFEKVDEMLNIFKFSEAKLPQNDRKRYTNLQFWQPVTNLHIDGFG